MAVPEAIQVTHGFVGSRLVVDMGAWHAQIGAVFTAIHDWGQSPLLHQRFERLAHAVAEKDQAIRLAAQKHFAIALLTMGVVMSIAQDHRIAFALGRLFDALDNQRKEWIG